MRHHAIILFIYIKNILQRISNKGKIMSAYTDDGAVQYDIRKLLQICMRTEESGGAARTIDILRCMHLKAIYRRNDNDSDNMNIDPEYEMGNQQQPGIITTFKHINRRTLKSHLHQNCIGYALLVASSVDGYLYQFSSEGNTILYILQMIFIKFVFSCK